MSRDATRRRYATHRAAPEALATLQAAALRVLRPQLATVWIDTDPGPDGIPDRSGPTVITLHPDGDEDFATAVTLASAGPAVEAVSRAGQLVIARHGPGAPLLLRLTRAEHAALAAGAPEAVAWLVRTERPGTLERWSHGPMMPLWLLAVLVVGPVMLVKSLQRLIGAPSWTRLSDIVAPGIFGLVLIVVGVRVAAFAVRRTIRQSRVPG